MSRNPFLKNLFPSIFLISIFTFYFYPVLFEGKVFFFRDISHFAYPMKLYLARVWELGEWPFWYPHLVQGIPFLQQMHPGVFYPPSVLFLMKDFNLAFQAYFLLHHFILTISVYVLCRYWGNSLQASLCAAVTSLLGGYFLSIAAVYNHFQSAVWFPLILMMWQKYLEKYQTKYFLYTAIFLAFQVLGGGPEHAIFSVLLIYAYGLCLAKENSLIRNSVAILSLVLLALALSAIQWIPTYFFKQKLPYGSGLDLVASTKWSLNFDTLFDLFLPDNQTRFMEIVGAKVNSFLHNFYMGIVPIVILFFSLLVYRENRAIRFWLAVFGWGVFFGLGEFNPLYSLFHQWMPIFNLFRYPQKFFFLCSFALVFLLCFSLDHLIDEVQRNRQKIKQLLFVVFIIFLCVAVVFWINPRRGGFETLVILMLIAMAVIALHHKKITPSKFLNFMLVLILMDLMIKNSMTVPMIDKEFYTKPPVLAKHIGGTADSFRVYSGLLLEAKSNSNHEKKESRNVSTQAWKPVHNLLAWHLKKRNQLYPNAGTIYDVAYVDGMTTRYLESTLRWSKWFVASDIPGKKIILKRSNVKFWIIEEPHQSLLELNQRKTYKVEVFEDTLPRAFLVGDSVTMPKEQMLNFYFDPRFDPLKQVLLTESVAVKKAEDFSGQVVDIQYPPNKVNLKTRQNGEGFLVLLDTFFPGWEVRVDGKPQPIYRANYFYRAVKLGPGTHSIEFSYVPVGLKMGIYISVSAWVLILFMFFKPARVNP